MEPRYFVPAARSLKVSPTDPRGTDDGIGWRGHRHVALGRATEQPGVQLERGRPDHAPAVRDHGIGASS